MINFIVLGSLSFSLILAVGGYLYLAIKVEQRYLKRLEIEDLNRQIEQLKLENLDLKYNLERY